MEEPLEAPQSLAKARQAAGEPLETMQALAEVRQSMEGRAESTDRFVRHGGGGGGGGSGGERSMNSSAQRRTDQAVNLKEMLLLRTP